MIFLKANAIRLGSISRSILAVATATYLHFVITAAGLSRFLALVSFDLVLGDVKPEFISYFKAITVPMGCCDFVHRAITSEITGFV